ncbi:hypothetical protein Pmani_002330 [Petrolisthes manimaculis]|uniref:Glutathione transferase n=1 Tax=Petrolisthes manimaculis TaxID=1843537 RepID=A0AAE1UJG5_9EUCA|nr:hypothetical protein Pmani_002330 [Petrolisthes manimaculis]
MSNKASLSSLYAITAKHLSAGSACPPTRKGVIRCYTNKYCPFAQRAHLILAVKQVQHEFVLVNLKSKPEWLFEKNPLGKVPVLELDGQLLNESLMVCDCLEEMFPDPPLYPSNPWSRAKDRMLAQQWSKGSFALHKIFFSQGDEKVMAAAVEEIQQSLDIYEEELVKRNTAFFGGDKPGMLDYMIWPWAERFQPAKLLLGEEGILPPSRYPALTRWMERMMEDPAVLATYLSPEEHTKFYTTFDSNILVKKSVL